MDCVLLEIKKFLKKIENGQHEIEAGQWELHKDIGNINKAINDLKNLKGKFEEMKVNSSKQMELIRALQSKIQKITQKGEDVEPLTVSESSVEYEGVYTRSSEESECNKRNTRERSEEVIEIVSQESNVKSESDAGSSVSRNEQRQDEEGRSGKNERVERKSCRKSFKKQPYVVPMQNPTNRGHHASRPTTNDILQRYLKDSAKYMEKKRSKSSEKTFASSNPSEAKRPSSTGEYVSFWDEISSRAQPEPERETWKPKVKESSSEKTTENSVPKKFSCPKCPKEFIYELDFLNHKKKHRRHVTCGTCEKGFGSRAGLRERKVVHGMSSKSPKCFRCCYCTKTYASPKKLTEHLIRCRIISKSRRRR